MLNEQFKLLHVEFNAIIDKLRATTDGHDKYELLVKLGHILSRADALIQQAQHEVQDRIQRIQSNTF